MSNTWYPVLNYEECTECGSCFNKSTHGVYKLDGNRLVVVYPEGCVHGCHGCGELCPACAIEYVGDTKLTIGIGKPPSCDGNSGCCDSSSGCC